MIGLGTALLAIVLGVVFLWPAPRSGPEPIAYGRDTCAHCRMHLSQPGFAGELRDRDGVLTKYDDIGCLLRAMTRKHEEVPEAWVEDHGGGGLIPLVGAHLVRSAGVATPMGGGIVAFREEAVARAFAAEHGGDVAPIEDVLREPERWARGPGGLP